MSLTAQLKQTCDLYAPTLQANGKDGYTTAETSGEACYFERKITEVNNGKGQIELSDGLIVFDSDATVDYGYKVVIGGVSYRVIKCDPFTLHGTLHHYEAFVKQLGL